MENTTTLNQEILEQMAKEMSEEMLKHIQDCINCLEKEDVRDLLTTKLDNLDDSVYYTALCQKLNNKIKDLLTLTKGQPNGLSKLVEKAKAVLEEDKANFEANNPKLSKPVLFIGALINLACKLALGLVKFSADLVIITLTGIARVTLHGVPEVKSAVKSVGYSFSKNVLSMFKRN